MIASVFMGACVSSEGGAPEVIQRELFFDGAGSGAGIA